MTIIKFTVPWLGTGNSSPHICQLKEKILLIKKLENYYTLQKVLSTFPKGSNFQISIFRTAFPNIISANMFLILTSTSIALVLT